MTLRTVTLMASLALVTACATNGPAVTDGAASGADVAIDLQPILRFSPSPVTIGAGDTVEFRNVSAFVHTVSTEPSTPEEAAATALPPGADSFDSGDIPAGGVYRHTFSVPGTYRYFCDPHHGLGMTGTIIVAAS